MAIYIVNNHDGWLYDDLEQVFVSPTGRLASKPGAPFCGQLCASDHQLIIEALEPIGRNPEIYLHSDGRLEEVPDYNQPEEDDEVTTAEAEQFAANVENDLEPDSEVEVDGVYARTYVVGDITVNIVDIV